MALQVRRNTLLPSSASSKHLPTDPTSFVVNALVVILVDMDNNEDRDRLGDGAAVDNIGFA